MEENRDIRLLRDKIFQLSKLLPNDETLNELVVSKYIVKLPDNENVLKEGSELMNEILELAKQVGIHYGNKPDIFLEELSKIQNDNNEKFLSWLFDYMEGIYKPYLDGLPFQNMEEKEFQDMAEYCFQNYILQVIGTDELEERWKDKEEDFTKLRRIINRYIRFILWYSRSKKFTEEQMEKNFGLKKEYSNIIYQLMIGNEDKLWKGMMARRINYIEESLNELTEKINILMPT